MMEIDSVMVKATSERDLRRLVKAGGEIWQHYGKRADGSIIWDHILVRLPIAAAIRMKLIAPVAPSTPPAARAA